MDKSLIQFLKSLACQNTVYEYFAVSFLIFPQEILKHSVLFDSLKSVCAYGYVLHLSGDEFININLECEVWKNTKFHKIKQTMNESFSMSCIAFHAARRDYLRHQLGQLSLLSRQAIFKENFDV